MSYSDITQVDTYMDLNKYLTMLMLLYEDKVQQKLAE